MSSNKSEDKVKHHYENLDPNDPTSSETDTSDSMFPLPPSQAAHLLRDEQDAFFSAQSSSVLPHRRKMVLSPMNHKITF